MYDAVAAGRGNAREGSHPARAEAYVQDIIPEGARKVPLLSRLHVALVEAQNLLGPWACPPRIRKIR